MAKKKRRGSSLRSLGSLDDKVTVEGAEDRSNAGEAIKSRADEVFSCKFDTPTFYVCLASTGREYYLHRRVLTEKCPYFAALLSSHKFFVEQQTRIGHVPIPTSTEEAFDMVVEYMYTNTYQPPTSYEHGAKALLHSRLYIVADCMCMDDLKALALGNLRAVLGGREGDHALVGLGWSSVPGRCELSSATILDIARLIYNTDLEDIRPGNESLSAGEAPRAEDLLCHDPPLRDEITSQAEEVSSNKSPSPSHDPRREIQVLVAEYVASYTEYFREDTEFLAYLTHGGPFITDIIMAVTNGTKIGTHKFAAF